MRFLWRLSAAAIAYLVFAAVVIIFMVQNINPPIRVDFLVFGPFDVPLPFIVIFFIVVGIYLTYALRRRLRME